MSKLDARRLFFIAMVGFIVGCCASLSRRIIRCCSHLAWCRRLARAFCSRLFKWWRFRYIPKANTARPWALWGSLSGSRPQSARQSRVFIVDAWGWRAVFVALGVVSAVVTLLAIPFLPNVMRKPATHQRFDALSAVLFSFGAICLLVATACIEQSGQGVVAGGKHRVGRLLLFAFARRQLRISDPLLKLSCFCESPIHGRACARAAWQSVVYGGFHHGSAVRARCARRLGGGFWLGHSARRGAVRLF